jgi:hypothetical protein
MAVEQPPAPVEASPAAPATKEEAWPEPMQPQADVEKAVDDFTQPAAAAKKTPATVAAKPRPTIRHSPPAKRTAPPTPTSTDTEDLYDTR